MAKSISHVSRTFTLLKEKECMYQKVEVWNQYAKKRQDLFGFIDILCVVNCFTVGIQVCGSDYSSHKKKFEEHKANIIKWLKPKTNKLLIVGWRKLKVKGMAKRTSWEPRIEEVIIKNGEIFFIKRQDI